MKWILFFAKYSINENNLKSCFHLFYLACNFFIYASFICKIKVFIIILLQSLQIYLLALYFKKQGLLVEIE